MTSMSSRTVFTLTELTKEIEGRIIILYDVDIDLWLGFCFYFSFLF